MPSHEDRYNSLNPEAEARLGHMGQQCCDLDQHRHKASQSCRGAGLSKLTVQDLKKPGISGGSLMLPEDSGSHS